MTAATLVTSGKATIAAAALILPMVFGSSVAMASTVVPQANAPQDDSTCQGYDPDPAPGESGHECDPDGYLRTGKHKSYPVCPETGANKSRCYKNGRRTHRHDD